MSSYYVFTVNRYIRVINEFEKFKEYYFLYTKLNVNRYLKNYEYKSTITESKHKFAVNKQHIPAKGYIIYLIAKLGYIYEINDKNLYFPEHISYFVEDNLKFSIFAKTYYYKKSPFKYIFCTKVFYYPNYHIELSKVNIITYKIHEFLKSSYELLLSYKYLIGFFLFCLFIIKQYAVIYFIIVSAIYITGYHNLLKINPLNGEKQ